MFPSIIFNSDNKIRIDENVFIDIKLELFLEKYINEIS